MHDDLFSNNEPQIMRLDHGELWYFPSWLTATQTQQYFSQLKSETPWEQTEIRIAGRLIPIPRLNAWYGDPGTAYQYSGRRFTPLPFTSVLNELKVKVIEELKARFEYPPLHINSALLNQYRDGRDSVGWHADDEDELGDKPQIVSISLGGTRRFLLKPKTGGRGKAIEMHLTDGSLLFMFGDIQRYWLHSIPKTERFSEMRINITFREVINKRI